MPIKAHWLLGKIERYHKPLRKAYKIIKVECKDIISQTSLQTVVKAVNNIIGPNGLIPTLLVFGAIPRITNDLALLKNQTQRAETVNKAIKEFKKIMAQKKVHKAIKTKNGPNIESKMPISLEFGLKVLVYREKHKWTGPFEVFDILNSTIIVNMVNSPSAFRNTHIKPYHRFTKQTEKNNNETTSMEPKL